MSARREGEDYILDGEKTWISSGHYSDFNICVARVNDDPAAGLALFLVLGCIVYHQASFRIADFAGVPSITHTGSTSRHGCAG